MREYRVPSNLDQHFVLYVESETRKIFERDPNHRGLVRLRVERMTTRTLISRAEAKDLIYGKPALARWVPQERAKLVFPDGRREARLLSVCKKFTIPELPGSSGSARMSPPAMVRKRSNRLRGRGRVTRNGDWRRSAYEELLAKDLAGDAIASASLNDWRVIRFHFRKRSETGEVEGFLTDPKTGKPYQEEFGSRWRGIDQHGQTTYCGVEENLAMATSKESILFFPNA